MELKGYVGLEGLCVCSVSSAIVAAASGVSCIA